MTKHFPRNARQSFGRKYRVLMETCPDMATECGCSRESRPRAAAALPKRPAWSTGSSPLLKRRAVGLPDGSAPGSPDRPRSRQTHWQFPRADDRLHPTARCDTYATFLVTITREIGADKCYC